MIKIVNPDKLTRQPFFQDLVSWLYPNKTVTLRQIKQAFPTIRSIDRFIEDYVQAGYLLRKDRRYSLTLPLATDSQAVDLDKMLFVDTESPLYQELLTKTFTTALTNQTNQAVLLEETDLFRTEATLANYFYALRRSLPLPDSLQPLYAVLGDVNQEYALKYITAFLLKFSRRSAVPQKRPDIFVQALEELGYIAKNADGKYELRLNFAKESLTFRTKAASKG
ncbi:DUF1803 domain-containing protein [Streptococcus sp. H49]|uniref:DUF1803 domain-containing protein n=1 Tax=Streptococcus huangxiaojuni TaxID=3237239 RepID=UPI0034A3E186